MVFVRFGAGFGWKMWGWRRVRPELWQGLGAQRLDSGRRDGYNKDRKRRCDKRLALSKVIAFRLP